MKKISKHGNTKQVKLPKVPMNYEDGKTRISGDASDVRFPIWFKMIMKEMKWIILLITLLVAYRVKDLIPVLIKYLVQSFFLILFAAQVVYLSG
jgi:hypothetical protein